MQPQKTAFLFPGQGSQTLTMGSELCKVFPSANTIFEKANDQLGFSLSQIAWDGPVEQLNDTINTQPALLIHSAAVLKVFSEQFPGFKPAFVAGHSMGELSAIFAAGAITFNEILSLSRTRGVLMKQAGETNPGGMAAILGLDIPKLEEICYEASTPQELVQVANDNCPGQVVISGAVRALDKAIELANSAGARRAVKLAVSIAAHSPMMSSAQDEFNQAVDQTKISGPTIPIIGNVSATPLNSNEEIRLDLKGQLMNRVRWTESINFMIQNGVETFIEMGNGNVLAGLVKRISKDVNTINLSRPNDFEKIITN